MPDLKISQLTAADEIVTADWSVPASHGAGPSTRKISKSQFENRFALFPAGVAFAAAGGTVSAMTATFTPPLVLTDGLRIAVRAVGRNTGALTLAPDGGTARSIVRPDGSALWVGDVTGTTHVLQLAWDNANTRWLLLNPNQLPRFDVRRFADTFVIDGTTDMRAACQAAIDACVTAGGGEVLFPAGAILLSGASSGEASGTIKKNGLLVPDSTGTALYAHNPKIILKGQGRATRLIANEADMVIVRFAGSWGAVRDMAFINSANSGNHLGVWGLGVLPQRMDQTSTEVYQIHNEFTNLFFQNCATAIAMQAGPVVGPAQSGCWYNKFYHCEIMDCDIGVDMRNPNNSGGSQVNRNTFFACRQGASSVASGGYLRGNTGVRITAGNSNRFISCSFEGLEYAVKAGEAAGSTVGTCINIASASAGGATNAENVFDNVHCELLEDRRIPTGALDMVNANALTIVRNSLIDARYSTFTAMPLYVDGGPASQVGEKTQAYIYHEGIGGSTKYRDPNQPKGSGSTDVVNSGEVHFNKRARFPRHLICAPGDMTAETWSDNTNALQVGRMAFTGRNDAADGYILSNLFINGSSGGWRRMTAAPGTVQAFDASVGDWIWYMVPTGPTGEVVALQARMTLKNSGELWVMNTTDQGAHNLQVGGTGVWGAGVYTNGSDQRVKEDIAPLESGLDAINALRPVTYRYKADWCKDTSIQPGFIAQDLQADLAGKPYLDGIVKAGSEYLSVSYQNFIPLLVKAVQELSARVAELEARP